MAARNSILGARAAVYRGAAVLCGAEADSNTRAFCAEGAENFFSKTRSRNGAQKVPILYSNLYNMFNFSASGKIFEIFRGVYTL